MSYLLLTIICSTCLMLVFKYLDHLDVKTFPVIVINYLVCTIIGFSLESQQFSITTSISQPWFPFAIFIGLMFITVFYLVGLSTRLNGVTPATVAFKLSVVVPVAAAFVLYGDAVSFLKITGILLALVAIYLTSKTEEHVKSGAGGILKFLPVFIFIGSGIVDATINYTQTNYLVGISYNSFLIFLFGTATTLGSIALIFNIMRGKNTLHLKTIGAGILLGVPNYGSLYFMIKTLEFSGMESSAIWPVNNIGIITLSSFSAFFLFKERISRVNILGIVIAIISIILIGYTI